MESIICPNCNFENPAGMKFCGNCGKSLINQEKKGERKIISILYVDIAGFTTISETMDPEKIQDMLNTIFKDISYSINKFGGTVHKYIGDEVMALFGAPIAYENHAERAARAAYEISKSIKDLIEKIKLSINLHIALHSGEVVLGKVGSGDVHDYTVIGDTVNVAARLEKIAPAGKILVSKEFFERTKHAFIFETFGDVQLKGKSKPTSCYILKGLRTSRKKIRGIRETESPLLGRDKELRFLNEQLNNLSENKSLRMVTIKGQPGIGKSRLFREFCKNIDKNKHFLFETRSLPFGQEELHPFKELIRNITSTSIEMDEMEAKKNVQKALNNLFGTTDLGVIDVIDVVLDFVSVKKIEMEPRRKHQIIYYAIENRLKKLSEKRNLIIAFEDFHWIDSSSLLLLKHLLDFLSGRPIIILLITRPLLKNYAAADFLSVCNNQPYSETLILNPLARETSLKLITSFLSIDKISNDIKQRIVDKGEGNPLFIEELLKILMDKKLIYRQGNEWKAKKNIDIKDIPQTINEIIMGRVDLLDKIEKKILQYASVIGRIFWDKPIKEAFRQSLLQEFSMISSKGFVTKRVDSIFEDAREYIFNHILIQESIYSSILKRVRKKIHAEFAEWLETTYPDMKNAISNLIAFHYEKGGVWENSGYYYTLSGKEAAKNYNNDDAIKHYNKAQAILEEHKPDSKHLFELYKQMGKIMSRIGNNNDAKKYLEIALKCASTNYENFTVEQSLSNLYQKMSMYKTAMEKLQIAKSYLTHKNTEDMIELIFDEVWLYYLSGDINAAFKHLNKAQEIHKKSEEKLDEKVKESLLAQLYSKRAILYNYTGDLKGSLTFYSKALEIYKKCKSHSGLAAIYNNLAGVHQRLGECSKAIEMYKNSQELDKRMGNRLGTAIGLNNLASMYIFLNDLDNAQEFLNKYINLSGKIHNTLGFGYAYLNFGSLFQKKKEYSKALQYYKKALTVFEEVKSKRLIMSTYESLLYLFFETDNTEGVKKYINLLADYLEDTKNLELKASLKRFYAKLAMKVENYDNAEIFLKHAREIYREMSSLEELIPLYVDFIDLYNRMGNTQKINYFRKRGKNIVETFLKGIKENRLKNSFLKRTDVIALLS
jgi:class 3 adenylate cyclase/predicted ATPase